MIGVLVNTVAVLVGGTIGCLFKKGLPERLTATVMHGIGLCTLYIGLTGVLSGQNVLVLILSTVVGAILGTLLDVDKRINQLGDLVGSKWKGQDGAASIGQGFVTASLLFCIGAMTICGSLEAGLTGNNQTLFTKSLLDLISSTMLASSLGIGVVFSAAFVLVFQGGLVLLAQVLQPILTDAAIAEIVCAGSLMILGLGLNLLGVTKIKIANFLPAILLAPLFSWLLTTLNIG